MDQPVKMAKSDRREIKALKDHRGRRASQEIKGLSDRRGYKGRKGFQESQARRVCKGQSAQLVRMVKSDRRGCKDYREKKVTPAT